MKALAQSIPFFPKKVSTNDVVSRKQSRAAKKAVAKAVDKSIEDQDSMIRRAKAIKS